MDERTIKLLVLYSLFSIVLCEYKRVCYFTNWAQYRKGFPGWYSISDHYEDGLCTHIIYAFAKVAKSGNIHTIMPYEDNDENEGFVKVNHLKTRDAQLKTLLAVGGWNHGSNGFKEMVATKQSRQDFIQSAIIYLKKHNFDGLDLDWEYPAQRGSTAGDKNKFTKLCKELKTAFAKHNLLVTVAVAAGPGSADRSYEMFEISKHLDFISLMSYDLHGKWEGKTGHHTDCNPKAQRHELSVLNSVDHWLASGMESQKLILGLASYGRTWKLSNPCKQWGLGSKSPWTGGAKGQSTRESGFLAYYEICHINWESHICSSDSKVMAPYGSDGRDFIAYDDEESIAYKVKNIMKKRKLGGFMFWALDLDDFKDMCKTGKQYPLLKAAIAAARNENLDWKKCQNKKRSGKCIPPPTLPPSKNGCKVNPDGPWANDRMMDKWCKNVRNCPSPGCGPTYSGCKTCQCVCGPKPTTLKPKKTTPKEPNGNCVVPNDLSNRKKCVLNQKGPWAGQQTIHQWCQSVCPIDRTCKSEMCCCESSTKTVVPKTTTGVRKSTKPIKRTTQTPLMSTKVPKKSTFSKGSTKVTRKPTKNCVVPSDMHQRKRCYQNKNGPWGKVPGIDSWCAMNCRNDRTCKSNMCCCDTE